MEAMRTNKTGIVSGSVGFASRAIVQLLLFGVMIVATRVLSIEAFGAYALASLFLILSRALFYVGPYEYLLKTQHSPSLYNACFGANLSLALGATGVLFAFYFIAPMIFQTGNVSMLIALLAPCVLLVATTAWYEAILLRSVQVRRYYLCTLAGDCLGAAVAVCMLLMGYGVVSLVIQTYVRLLTLLILYAVSVPDRPRIDLNLAETAAVLRWSKGRYAAVMLNFTSAYGADFILGALLSPVATGLYRASNRIVSTLTDLFAQPLHKIAQTNLSAQYARDEDSGMSWLTMLSGVGAIGWAALAALAILADDLVPFLLGEKWAAAVPIVIVFCVIKSFSMLDAVTTSFLVCHDQQPAMLKIQIVVAGAVVLLSWLFAPLGPLAVAIAVGGATSFISLTYGVMVMRLSKAGTAALIDLAKTSLPPTVGVCLALTSFKLAFPEIEYGGLSLVISIAVAAGGFLCGLYLVRNRVLAAIGSLGHGAGSIEATGASQ